MAVRRRRRTCEARAFRQRLSPLNSRFRRRVAALATGPVRPLTQPLRSAFRPAAPGLPAPRAMADISAVEETVKRLASHKGVVGIAIVNGDGVPIRTTLDAEAAVQYAALVSQLALKARHMVRELATDGTDDLQFLRVRSKKHEIMIAPGFDKVGAGGCGPRRGSWVGGHWPVAERFRGRQAQRSDCGCCGGCCADVKGSTRPHRASCAATHPPTTPCANQQDHSYTLLVVQEPQAE